MFKTMFKKRMMIMILAAVMMIGTLCTSAFACDGGSRYVGEGTYRYEVGGYYYGEDVTMSRFSIEDGSTTYVCPDSNARYLTRDELKNFSSMYLLLARNEIYARAGYTFGKPELARYFGYKAWYHPVKYFSESYLNAYESYNVKLIREEEERRGGPGYIYFDN